MKTITITNKSGNILVRSDAPIKVYAFDKETGEKIYIGPMLTASTEYNIYADVDETFEVVSESDKIEVIERSSRYEPGPGDSLVEEIDSRDLSLFDRMRLQILQEIGHFAGDKGYETPDEASDFEIDDEDLDVPLTPYEYKALVEEMPESEVVGKPGGANDEHPTERSEGGSNHAPTHESPPGDQNSPELPTDSR